jgi:hypothetical protein
MVMVQFSAEFMAYYKAVGIFTAFWAVTVCSLVDIYQHFQGREVSQVQKK